jgi:hypothetical protein
MLAWYGSMFMGMCSGTALVLAAKTVVDAFYTKWWKEL